MATSWSDLPLKKRLQITFTAIMAISVAVLSGFSLAFFYASIRGTAVRNLVERDATAQALMDGKRAAILDYASNLAADKTLQLLLDLDISYKLSEYLVSQASKEKLYHLTVFDAEGRAYSDVGYQDSLLAQEGRKISLTEEKMLERTLMGERVSMYSQLSTAREQAIPAISAMVPISRDRRIVGALAAHFVLGDNPAFFRELKESLGLEVALHSFQAPTVGSAELELEREAFASMTSSGTHFQRVSLIGTGLDDYRVLKDGYGAALGIFHLHQDGSSYRGIFLTAIFFYLLFALAMIIGIGYLVIRTSRRILDPIGTLMTGVKRISEGDLSHEILLRVHDEIGMLGKAFNEMRSNLSEKIDEINRLNAGLEAKVAERTAQIEDLNSKLKHYLSPQVYASLVGGERDASVEKHYRKKLTIFFSDLVNFTATSDSMEPEDLSNILNTYLQEMSIIAIQYGGTIDKYVGDAIMVFFGDPEFTTDKDHAVRAVSMSLDMLSKLEDLRQEWMAQGITHPFHVRIGINTGYCTVGNFGSDTKMDYTIIGNNVNLAARYEAAAEHDTILMSHETFMLVKEEFEVAFMGEMSLKGVPGTVKAYRPLRRAISRKREFLAFEGGGLRFLERSVDLSRATDEERASLRRQLADAVDWLGGA